MTLSRNISLAFFGGLALLMFITRFQPLEHFLELPDASWAVFFIAGFYLRGHARWAFPLLMLEAALIDGIATGLLGVSDFCITPAYGFLIPTHAVMWFGGHWLRGCAQEDLPGLVRLAGAAFVCTSLAYLISNGGFYWFGGRYAEPHVTEYLARAAQYYRGFLLVPCAYIATAALLHVGIRRVLRATDTSLRDAG